MSNRSEKIRVLSGIRASHKSLHLGILLGAVKGMIELQNNPKYETFYMVADLHGITTPFEVEELKRNRLGIAMDYLAAGIDPNKSTLFLQSDVPAHAALAFYISSEVSVNRLLRLPSYKDKIKQYPENQTAALFNYPILMAADILLYKAQEVPIGGDQIYHLEVTREIAKRLNLKYNLDFPLPRRFNGLNEDVVIPDLFLPGKKMSKSNPNGAIFLTDSLEVIKNKISKISTSTSGGPKFPKEGGLYVLYVLTKLFVSPARALKLEKDYLNGTVKYGKLKDELSSSIYKVLEPIQKKRKEYEDNPDLVRKILARGAIKADRIAEKTLREVKTAMGLVSQLRVEGSEYGRNFLQ